MKATSTATGEPSQPLLDTADVAAALGIERQTVRRYVWESRALGRRYSNHPFPTPDGKVGSSVYWNKERLPEILAWDAGRVGRGARSRG